MIKRCIVTKKSRDKATRERALKPFETYALMQAARKRVNARFGPEQPPGASEVVHLQPLPDGIQKLVDGFQHQV